VKRVAIFIDAGYLYAQGSACIQGNKAKRENIRLDHGKFVGVLKTLAQSVQPDAPLLRIYWYDGTSRGPTLDHRTLADLDDVKLRLGFINSFGQQKGVDSLLVTDLVELARNGAICDALLLGGDEDLRIGVQIAQGFGVRLHLIGIEPSRGSQSLQLRQEVDTKHEISSLQVQGFLSLIPTTVPSQPIVITPASTSTVTVAVHAGPVQNVAVGNATLEASLDQGIDGVIVKLNLADIADLNKALVGTLSVPALYDRRVLASCRSALGRDLTMDEKKLMRNRFIGRIRAMQQP
jgi:uncharacterized LabA/DUF88 family protein